MGVELGKIWPMIAELVKDGISLIPVREESDGVRPAKTPYGSWAEYQQRVAKEGELWAIMEQKNTTAIAAVCGVVSGNLECIDIDSKYYPGIDAILLSDIAKFYPHLYTRLRIHRTPSGGYHILYRIADHAPQGNIKLAGRMKTDEELQADFASGKRKPTKTVNFLETRGEGGYFLFPPSLGYTVHQPNPIPAITWEERCSLINLCQSYCEITKVAPSPKLTQIQDSIYTTNPFEDFNNQCDPVQLMESQGWKFLRENARFIWFTRPGKEDGVSASFNREKRVFFIFTTSTDLDEKRGYNPATLFAEFTHNGDKKAAFRELVQGGFGQVKRNVEQSLVKKAVINGTSEVPNNFSIGAKEQFKQLQEQFRQAHPYGVFWSYDENNKMQISREDFLQVAKSLGFRSYRRSVVQINGRFIERVDIMTFFNNMKAYIREDEEKVYKDVCDAYEKFIQASGKFIMDNRLEQFDDSECIYDDSETCYKFFQDVVIKITADEVLELDYDSLDGLVWSEKVINRNFRTTATASNIYERFINLATGDNNGSVHDYVRNILGFLCHDYNSSSSLYIIVMTEMVNDPKKGGGSGKNVLINSLSKFIGICTSSGSMSTFDDKFYSVWDQKSRVYFVPDIPKKINWEFLKSAIEDPKLNKKYVQEESISTFNAPKLVLNTNYSYEENDGGLKRRIIPMEFTNYFTIHGGPDVVFGKRFPTRGEIDSTSCDDRESNGDFDESDYKGYFDFLIDCVKYHLSQGRKLEKIELSDTGWRKKFSNQYNDKVLDFIDDHITGWVSLPFVEASRLQMDFDNFISVELKEKYKINQKTLLSAIEEFCDRHRIRFQKSVLKSINSIKKRVHIFEGVYEGEVVEDDGFPF